MSRDLHELLESATHEPVGLPTTAETWAAGRSRQRMRRLATAVGSTVVIVAVLMAGSMLVEDVEPEPEIVDQPSQSPKPESTGASGPDGQGSSTLPTLSNVAVASTMALDGGTTYESRFPDGTVVRAVDDGVAYPERLYGLDDGTVAWQGVNGIHMLGPGDESATTMALTTDDDPATRIQLVGVGEIEDEPVMLVEEGRAASLADDDGGTLSAVRLDGTSEVLLEFPFAWEHGIDSASLRNGWLLYVENEAGGQATVLRAADGTVTVINESDVTSEGHTLEAVALAEIDIPPGLAVIEHHVEHGDPDAPFGAGRLEIRSVDDATASEPAQSIDLPTDNVPKQLAVAGELAYLTLLPDSPELLQVNLHDGEVERFSAPGIVALHAGLQPRSPDAAPPAACVEGAGAMDHDAQAYVWLQCPDAATYAEGDSPARFFGIHRLRLVTDPRASTGDVAQRVEAMLEAIFAGPTTEERARGYSGIIDPAVDALAGVAFSDGVVTIELTDQGARAASAGTTARAVFQATVNAAVFGGFVDVESLRVSVQGDCAAWSTYGEGIPECVTYHRDDSASES